MQSLSPLRPNFHPYCLPSSRSIPSQSLSPPPQSRADHPASPRAIKIWDLPRLNDLKPNTSSRFSAKTQRSQDTDSAASSLAEYIRLIKAESRRLEVPKKPATRMRPKPRPQVAKKRKSVPPQLAVSATAISGPMLRPRLARKGTRKKSTGWQPLHLRSFLAESDSSFRVVNYGKLHPEASELLIVRKSCAPLQSSTPNPRSETMLEEGSPQRSKVKLPSKHCDSKLAKLEGWENTPRTISPICERYIYK